MSVLRFRRALGLLTVVGVTLATGASASATEAPSLDAYAGEAAVLVGAHGGRGPGGGGESRKSGGSGLAQSGEASASANAEHPQTTSAAHPSSRASTNALGTPASHSGPPSTAALGTVSTAGTSATGDSPLLSAPDILLLLIAFAGLVCASVLIRRLAHRPR